MYVFVCIDFNYIDSFLDMQMSMDSNSICCYHSNSVFYFPHITQPIQDDRMARPWPTYWCRRACSQILAHWLGHMCLPGSTPAACLPLKTEWFQCHLQVPAAVRPKYSWQKLSTPEAQGLAGNAFLSDVSSASPPIHRTLVRTVVPQGLDHGTLALHKPALVSPNVESEQQSNAPIPAVVNGWFLLHLIICMY